MSAPEGGIPSSATRPVRPAGLGVEYFHLGKFVRAARDFANYIAANAANLINYSERFCAGERISG